jgi:hypothetical protein
VGHESVKHICRGSRTTSHCNVSWSPYVGPDGRSVEPATCSSNLAILLQPCRSLDPKDTAGNPRTDRHIGDLEPSWPHWNNCEYDVRWFSMAIRHQRFGVLEYARSLLSQKRINVLCIGFAKRSQYHASHGLSAVQTLLETSGRTRVEQGHLLGGYLGHRICSLPIMRNGWVVLPDERKSEQRHGETRTARFIRKWQTDTATYVTAAAAPGERFASNQTGRSAYFYRDRHRMAINGHVKDATALQAACVAISKA